MPKESDFEWLENLFIADSKRPGLMGENSRKSLVELRAIHAIIGPKMTIVDFLSFYAEDDADAKPKRNKKARRLVKQPTH